MFSNLSKSSNMHLFSRKNYVSTSYLLVVFLLFFVGNKQLFSQGGTLANPIFSEKFGALANNTVITNTNTAFSYVRVGTGAVVSIPNQVIASTPSNFTGSSMIISAATTSISTVDKTGLTAFSSGTFTFSFRTPASLTSAVLLSGVGTGASFGSANGFTGAQLSAAFQVSGTNLQIRSNGAWTTVQSVSPSTSYSICIVFNNTAGSLSYGSSTTLPTNKCHVWINGTYVNEYATATAGLSASAFRIYATTGSFEVDNVEVYNSLPVVVSSAPVITSITAGSTLLSVAFTPPTSNGGSAISNYLYSINNGVSYTSANSTTSPIVITGLTNGVTYPILILAVNNAGNSPASNAMNGTPVAANTAPVLSTSAASNITATSSNLSGTITSNGGANISANGFVYSSSNSSPTIGGAGVTNVVIGSGNSPINGSITGLNANQLYYFQAYATNSVGTSYGGILTFTTLIPTAPVSTNASSIGSFGFTANWNAVANASNYFLDVYNPNYPVTTDLIISEYVEGSGNNKYLEIYNGTSATTNLANYQIRIYANGSPTVTSTIALSGTLNHGSTIIVKNNSASLSLPAGLTVLSSSFMNYNGNDAVAIYKVSTSSFVDIFGVIGSDPGAAWTSGSLSTLDKTLRRKTTVTGGITSNPAGTFTSLASQWDVYNIDVVTGIGAHGAGIIYLAGYQNLSVGNVLFNVVTGASHSTEYHYVVRAYIPNGTSSNSNEIIVFTSYYSALPIELLSFQANCTNGNSVDISWITASEHNTDYFLIEKSSDGLTWGLLAEQKAAGNSFEEIQYHVYDIAPKSSQVYYRLKQIDIDGKSEMFDPVTFHCNEENDAIYSYPNPSNEEFSIAIKAHSSDQKGNLQILNSLGKSVYSSNYNLVIGNNNIHVNAGPLSPGAYTIEINNQRFKHIIY